MGVSVLYKAVRDEIIPMLQGLSDEQISAFLRTFNWRNTHSINSQDLPQMEDFRFKDNVDEAIAEVNELTKNPSLNEFQILKKALEGGTVELVQAKKYWKIKVQYVRTEVEYGSISGKKKTKKGESEKMHDSLEDAQKFAEDTIKTKIREGYKRAPLPFKIPEKYLTNASESKEKGKEEVKEDEESDDESGPELLTRTEIGKMKKAELLQTANRLGIKEAEPSWTVAKLKEHIQKAINEQKVKIKPEKKEEEKETQEQPKKHKIEPSTESSNINSPFATINQDLLSHILLFLEGPEIAKVASVCSSWNKAASKNSLWKSKFQERYASVMHPQKFTKYSTLFLNENTKENDWKKVYILQYRLDSANSKAMYVDTDKAGDAVEWLVARYLNTHDPSDPYPSAALDKVWFKPDKIGQDVSMNGSVDFVSAEKVRKLTEKLSGVSGSDLIKFLNPEDKDFPQLMGGLEIKNT